MIQERDDSLRRVTSVRPLTSRVTLVARPDIVEAASDVIPVVTKAPAGLEPKFADTTVAKYVPTPSTQSSLPTAMLEEGGNLQNLLPIVQFIVKESRNRSAPIITGDNLPFFDDRLDTNTKWYFPDFKLKEPLKDSFTLKCYQYGVDLKVNPIYCGDAAFVVSKEIPAAIQQLILPQGNTKYNEIPLNGMTMSFIVTLCDPAGNKSTLIYPAQIAQNGDDYTINLKLETQDSLASFYKFVSDPVNKNYCEISIKGSFFGYVPAVKYSNSDIDRSAFRNTHFQTLQAGLKLDVATSPPPSPSPISSLLASRLPDLIFHVSGEEREHNPVVVPNDPYEIKEAIQFLRIIQEVNYDWHDYPLSYVATLGGAGTSYMFGGNPPFGGSGTHISQWQEFPVSIGNLPNYGIKNIYRSTYNGNFLVIPERYMIALDTTEDEHLLRPAAYLVTVIDASGLQHSTASFQFNIAPGVSPYQLLQIKKLILNNVPANPKKSVDDIFIDFPDKVAGDAGNIVSDSTIPKVVINSMGTYPNGVAGSQYFNLQFQNVSIGDNSASLVVTRLTKTLSGSGIIGKITFELDAGTETSPPQSTIDLSLYCISGNVLEVLQNTGDGSGHYLMNRTLYDLEVDAYQTPDSNEQPIRPALPIPAKSIINLDAAGISVNLSQAIFDYDLDSSSPNNGSYIANVLKEVRLDNDNISDDIIVTNNTGLFSLYHISSIDIAISIINPSDSKTVLFTMSKSLIIDGAINYIPFTLPIAKYLSKLSAIYTTVLNFTDGKPPQVNDLQVIDDLNSIGKIINLTVSKLNLQKS